MKYILACLLLMLVTIPQTVFAATDLTPYKSVIRIPDLNTNIPKVVEISLPTALTNGDFLIIENGANTAQPYQIKQAEISDTAYQINSSTGNGSLLIDKDRQTYIDYPLTADGNNQATLTYTFTRPALLSGITLRFADFSKAPEFVRIHTIDASGSEKIILDTTAYRTETIRFPEQNITSLVVTLMYTQPVRLTEAAAFEEKSESTTTTLLRFLAKPGENYSIYFDPDKIQNNRTSTAGNYFLETDPLRPQVKQLIGPNPLYKPSDTDNDGISDANDNCPSVANSDQQNSNANIAGDACDDTDYDGVINVKDNCPEDANSNQKDVDGDSLGDICDPQESRFTEQYPWLPWAAMGGTVIVIVVLALQMTKSKAMSDTTDV